MKENGVVKWFNGAKGYGFIQRSSGEDVFVHFSAIQDSGYRTLNEGEAVEFECTQGPKGLSAANVVRNGPDFGLSRDAFPRSTRLGCALNAARGQSALARINRRPETLLPSL